MLFLKGNFRTEIAYDLSWILSSIFTLILPEEKEILKKHVG